MDFTTYFGYACLCKRVFRIFCICSSIFESRISNRNCQVCIHCFRNDEELCFVLKNEKIDDEEREIEREWDKSSCVRRATKTFNLFVRLFVRFTK